MGQPPNISSLKPTLIPTKSGTSSSDGIGNPTIGAQAEHHFYDKASVGLLSSEIAHDVPYIIASDCYSTYASDITRNAHAGLDQLDRHPKSMIFIQDPMGRWTAAEPVGE